MIRRWRRRLRYWLQRDQRARLLREEMEIHLEMKIQALMDEGMTNEDARSTARRQIGNLTRHQEESRGTWIACWISDLAQDAVFALRKIRKEPGFAVLAVISAALGIGACSTIFGLANFALFYPLPVSEPSRLMSVSGTYLPRGKIGISISYPAFEDARQARSFQDMTAFFQFMPATISSHGEPQRYWGSLVTANYFDVIRPAFVLGRGFDASRDDRPGQAPVVVLSYRLWRTRFNGDSGIIGRVIELNKRKVLVAGVTSPGFRGTELMFFSDFWVPFSMSDVLAEAGMGGDRLHNRDAHWLMTAGRLRDGVSVQEAAAELAAIAKRLSAAYPATDKDTGFHVERAGQANPGFRKMIVVLFSMLLCVAAMVLCTACANVANLLLARASARHQEIATRLAIGAGRGRLVRQLLTESMMLAALGGIFGCGLAQLGAGALGRARIPLAMPVDFSVSLDYRVILFSIALSALTGVIFGLAPALRATQPDLVSALKDEPVQFGRWRRFGLRSLLVVVQVTICMVMLICSGLFLRSLYAARKIDVGFSHRNLLLLSFDPSLNRYSPNETRRLIDAMMERTRAIPGVESVAIGSSVPLNMEGTQNAFVPENKISNKEQNNIFADIYSVTPGFFETFGIRMIEGEDFRQGMTAESAAIVNQALADKAFPKQNPIGRHILYLGNRVRVVGLVATTKSRSIGEDPHPCLYFPIAKDPHGNDSLSGMTLVLRTRGNPAGYAGLIRQTIRDIDPTLALFEIRTMDMQLYQALFFPRTAAWLFGLAGFLGLAISTVGIYGLISFAVARQTKEIGIRMAMGARRIQVLRMVLKEGLVLTAVGSVTGVALATALSRTAASLLYGVSSTDTLTFIGVPVFLLLIALIACLVPAGRAASLDPISALRYE